MAAPKMVKAERREQLLATAWTIVRDEGTDALTLGSLAVRAGVSKPVAYEHFKTRSGLLIALNEQINQRQIALLRLALERTEQQLEHISRVIAVAYMDCNTSVGPEWHAIAAALKGDEEMETYQNALNDRYVDFYLAAFRPCCTMDDILLRRRCVAIVGAAEAISREMVRGRLSESTASDDLSSLIQHWLL
ncbi:TetR/AcrR family transcriptional regulator [Pseudomonas nabeulensis]|uniref:TetR/AcrR family transcriptional regulator n=1 Tax=Pseudomonas nabeulensis TaxID=2293833 RepID=A0A4Z0AH01_9PSED|nr:TetR/AcrR family transcriptional regulator [Pseudomonas nabeulensis]TFY85524.1 TetR/AcrR family transcriptional regulator [Pseudomonas nabeulensis]